MIKGKEKARKAASWLKRNRSVSIPMAVICVLGAALFAHAAVQSVPDWWLARQSPLATRIPDTADIVVTVRLDRIAERESRNALHRWMAGENEHAAPARDWRRQLASATGFTLSEADLAAWAGREAAAFKTADGWGLLIESRSDAKVRAWAEGQTSAEWTIAILDGVVLMTSSDAVERDVNRTGDVGARTSIASTDDYRRAAESHELRGATVSAFARLRAIPRETGERVAGPLDCAKTRWISWRMRWDAEKIEGEVLCVRPARGWKPALLAEREALRVPDDASIVVAATFPANWERIDERVRAQSIQMAELIRLVGAIAAREDEESRDLTDELAGTVVIWRHADDSNWSMRVPWSNQRGPGITAPAVTAEATVRAIAGRWGAEAARMVGDENAVISHPLWNWREINVQWDGEGITMSTTDEREELGVNLPETELQGPMYAAWDGKTNAFLLGQLTEQSAAWAERLGKGSATTSFRDGLYHHKVEMRWANE